MQFKFLSYEFKPSLVGMLMMVVLVALFVKLGFWQYGKATLKQEIQKEYQQSVKNGVQELSQHIHSSEKLQYQKVKTSGEYATKYQILLDNQVENSIAGYHVLTPLSIVGTDQYVLVNRGWIAGKTTHADVPVFDTPAGMQQVEGMVWLPSKKIFTLEDKAAPNQANQSWQQVWQHLDMERYRKIVPLKLLPVIIKLDAQSKAGGFVRNWQMPAERIATHLSYAYQWFGFAFAAIAIYLYMSFKRIE